MPLTSNDLANEALLLFGGNMPAVSGQSPTWDNSTAGKALQFLYVPTYRAVLRQFGWDAARSTFTLVLSGNTAPYPWTFEYLYPTGGVQVNSLLSAADDPNNPQPWNFNVANAVVATVQQRVIWTTLANALCRYTNQPSEAAIDDDLHQAIVSLLASSLSMAIAGKPDVASAMLDRGSAFERIGESRQD